MTRYRTIDALQEAVKFQSTKDQITAIGEWEKTGWAIYGAKHEGAVTVVFMSHEHCLGPLAMYPDGTVQRAIKGKKSVEYSWIRARKAFDAQFQPA